MKTYFSFLEEDYRTINKEQLIANISNKPIEDNLSFNEILQSISPNKRRSLLSAIELYKRELKKELKQILGSNDIYEAMKPILMDLPNEEFWVIFLNRANKIIKTVKMSSGNYSSTIIDVKMIMKTAIICNAEAIALIHNHPSGNINPSKADDNFTKNVKTALDYMDIKMLDHIIIGGTKYYSYSDNGKI